MSETLILEPFVVPGGPFAKFDQLTLVRNYVREHFETFPTHARFKVEVKWNGEPQFEALHFDRTATMPEEYAVDDIYSEEWLSLDSSR